MIINIIAWVVFGLIAGALARLIVPGRQAIGWLMTIVLGIVGALVGGFLFSFIGLGGDGNEFSITNMLGAVLGGVLVLLIYLWATKGSTTTT